MTKTKLIALSLLLVLLWASPALAQSPTVDNIASQLVCQCGCNLVLNNCLHEGCGSRDALTASIEQQLSQGKSEREIIQFFVASYGEQVLAAPTKKGFNLTVWILPFVSIVAGGGGVYFALRVWAKRGQHLRTSDLAQGEEAGEEYRRRVDQELEDLLKRGGPL